MSISDINIQLTTITLGKTKKMLNFVPPFARMAESVDAPVSNTGGATHPGSIPGPGTNNDC